MGVFGPVSLQELEHPEYGTLRVFWRWEYAPDGNSGHPIPVAIEFDLFTPDSEKEVILHDLRMRRSPDRIDSTVRVTASEAEADTAFTRVVIDPKDLLPPSPRGE